jgi:uncharacterized protein (TIGR02246 family)
MRITDLTLIAASALLIGACSPATPAAAPVDDATREILAADTLTTTGWNTGNLDTYLAAYVDSATTVIPTGVVRGRDTIGDIMRKGFWRTGRPLQQLHYEHMQVRMLGRDYALLTGEFVLTGNGRPDRTGWFTTIWTRTPQGWRMIHDHSS